jgi:4-amino-4-deoxy-L-arabinose transferase-like glycosyltransferase
MKAEPTVIIHAAPPTRPWHRIALGVIVALAAFLNFYQLGQGGYPNLYYAAAIKSMLVSWHTFFFVSFDPGGFVTIDKPPLGFWLQAASAKLFGLSPWSVLLPQALAGLLAVPLLYYLVRRTFGPVPGLLAALALALTPITVVMSRNNSIDSVLTFTILLASWPVLKAAETGCLRWLLLGAALVGLAFNVKTLEAYMVVPALALVYLLGSSVRWRTRILHLILAFVVMAIISLSWMTIVDLTPASQRPYVGSSSTNSELELALGYNGIQRITGNMFGRGGGAPRNNDNNNRTPQSNATPGQTVAGPGQANGTPSGQPAGGPAQAGNPSGQAMSGPGQPGGGQGQGSGPGGGPGGGGGGVFNTGQPGLFRLFNGELGSQASWLLAFALASIALLVWQARKRLPLDHQGQSLVLWGVWLLTMGAVFSVSGFFHTYYLIIIGPAVSALFGIGAVAFWREYRQPGWRGWLLPAVLLGAVAVQIYMLAGYPQWSSILTPVLIALGLVAACVLVALHWQSLRSSTQAEARISSVSNMSAGGMLPLFRRAAVSLGFLALLIVPGVWDGISLADGAANSGVPAAGPRQMSGFGGGMPGSANRNGAGNPPGTNGNAVDRNASANRMPFMGGGDNANSALQQYLLANQGKVKFLVAVASSNEAESLIMNTGKPVMALGGFSGSDPILTTDSLVKLVDNGTVRYFLLGSGGGFGGRGGGTTSTWVSTHCSTVPTSAWQTNTTSTTNTPQGFGGGGAQQLYDCAKHS